MKTLTLLFTFILLSNFSNAQLISGDLLESNRYLLSSFDFTIKSSREGIMYYEVAVNEQGKVTSQRFLPKHSTLSSSLNRMDAINYIKKFEFLAGSLFPKFQYVTVQINFVKEDKEEVEIK